MLHYLHAKLTGVELELDQSRAEPAGMLGD